MEKSKTRIEEFLREEEQDGSGVIQTFTDDLADSLNELFIELRDRILGDDNFAPSDVAFIKKQFADFGIQEAGNE